MQVWGDVYVPVDPPKAQTQGNNNFKETVPQRYKLPLKRVDYFVVPHIHMQLLYRNRLKTHVEHAHDKKSPTVTGCCDVVCAAVCVGGVLFQYDNFLEPVLSDCLWYRTRACCRASSWPTPT